MNGFLRAAVAGPNPLIMEIKKNDADGTDLLGGRPVPEVVDSYHRAGAGCLSVVTGRWFGGDDGLLQQVRSLTDLPLLQKDFITRRDQLAKARDLGVAAVLLTARLLPAKGLNNLAEQALELGLVPFIEVASAAEIAAFAHPGDSIIAVNNKDIRSKEKGEADLSRSENLIGAVRESGTPCAVSASGVDSPDAALRLLRCGYQALLVGTAIVSGRDLAAWEPVTSGHYRTLQVS